jgi:CheY-like chemotaxis protein
LPIDSKLNGKIVLVDDEPAVRKLVKMYLERKGIAVIDAPSGDAAFDLLVRENLEVSLLVTDVTMPGLSGRELAGRVRQLRPALPILLISGYAEQPPETSEDFHYLRKPLDLPRLLLEIETLTSSAGKSAAA